MHYSHIKNRKKSFVTFSCKSNVCCTCSIVYLFNEAFQEVRYCSLTDLSNRIKHDFENLWKRNKIENPHTCKHSFIDEVKTTICWLHQDKMNRTKRNFNYNSISVFILIVHEWLPIENYSTCGLKNTEAETIFCWLEF